MKRVFRSAPTCSEVVSTSGPSQALAVPSRSSHSRRRVRARCREGQKSRQRAGLNVLRLLRKQMSNVHLQGDSCGGDQHKAPAHRTRATEESML
eukprot:4636463-Prymnesium_polylepis.2